MTQGKNYIGLIFIAVSLMIIGISILIFSCIGIFLVAIPLIKITIGLNWTDFTRVGGFIDLLWIFMVVFIVFLVFVILGLGLSYILTGFGILKRKSRARTWFLYFHSVSLLIMLAFTNWEVVLGEINKTASLINIISLLLLLSMQLFGIYFLTRPSIKELFS